MTSELPPTRWNSRNSRNSHGQGDIALLMYMFFCGFLVTNRLVKLSEIVKMWLSGKIDGHWHAHYRTLHRSDAPLTWFDDAMMLKDIGHKREGISIEVTSQSQRTCTIGSITSDGSNYRQVKYLSLFFFQVQLTFTFSSIQDHILTLQSRKLYGYFPWMALFLACSFVSNTIRYFLK